MSSLNWNKERFRTRDLLLEYNLDIVPTLPKQTDLILQRPWKDTQLESIENQLYRIAKNSGYTGTENEFFTNFGYYISNTSVVYTNYANFPINGERNKLYFDIEKKILYYWNNGYYPVNTTLIPDTILEGGEA